MPIITRVQTFVTYDGAISLRGQGRRANGNYRPSFDAHTEAFYIGPVIITRLNRPARGQYGFSIRSTRKGQGTLAYFRSDATVLTSQGVETIVALFNRLKNEAETPRQHGPCPGERVLVRDKAFGTVRGFSGGFYKVTMDNESVLPSGGYLPENVQRLPRVGDRVRVGGNVYWEGEGTVATWSTPRTCIVQMNTGHHAGDTGGFSYQDLTLL